MTPHKQNINDLMSAVTSILRKLYETRRQSLPAMGLRSRPAMIVSAILALALASILLSLSWVQRSDLDYLTSSSVVTTLENITWDIELPNKPKQSLPYLDLSKILVSDFSGKPYTLTARIPTSVISAIKQSAVDEAIVLALPGFLFLEATLETTWTETRKFAAGEYLSLSFQPLKEPKLNELDQSLTLKVIPRSGQKTILPSAVNQIPMFLSGQIRFQKFQDFVASRRIGSGKQLADIGRIVLALFCVLLFIFVDSSPECLGLGMFMSLKALGVVAAQRWYPDSMLPAWLIGALPSFLLGFADFMQLYFFTQLARLFKPRPMTWLGVGLIFGVVYSMGATMPTLPDSVNWSREVWRYRNLLIGLSCLACALPVSLICLRDKQYHRATALLIASSGVLSQVITPLISDIQGVTDMLWYRTWYNLLETHTPYVFALSTFINVSTLENRVKTLTNVGIQAKLMEQEMSLGRTVQEAFFRTPEMPVGITLEVSHQAEMFVSGDMIYSHHDKVNHTVTALLCDVTGHGVQAALKASVCSVICDSIWDVNKLRIDDRPFERLEILHKRAVGFFDKTSAQPEMLAIVGCEVLLKSRMAYIYRMNAVFPMIVSNSDGKGWRANVILSPSDTIQEIQLNGVSFIILFSDGLIDSSRTYKRLNDWLRVHLAGEYHLTAPRLKEIILTFDQWHDTHDDRTMCILEVA